ncbi:MAG: response regulator [Candidatus Contendobacter sp.]|nr:response regulator [Gammaproteobacteria bacterium]MCC8993982.1 response regulator [Candidatus Contendobacter sp.]
MNEERPRVLCVDDEPRVLEGLQLHLRRAYEVRTAASGLEGLEAIQRSAAPFALVLSDMRMPGMDGAAFLSQVRQRTPDTVRMLLTGQADIESAIAAVNEGQIFRFLTKPCPPKILLAAFDAATQQYRLITAERVLLEQTLRGVIKTLTDILSLANPAAFGRANRIRRHATDLAKQLGIQQDWWQLDVAAMLSQLSCITLPPDTLDKLYQGGILSEKEQVMVERLPAMTFQLLGGIPRLEEVIAILNNQDRACQFDPKAPDLPRLGGHLLRLASDFDTLINHGYAAETTLNILRTRTGRYDPTVLDAFIAIRNPNTAHRNAIKEISILTLKPGMVLAEDIRTAAGALLSVRGHEVTDSFLARLYNFQANLRKQTVRVLNLPE